MAIGREASCGVPRGVLGYATSIRGSPRDLIDARALLSAL
jgi:hypothetical protein